MALISRRRALALASSTALATPAIAQPKQAPGVTASEILLGQTMPYSGPASGYAPIGHVEVAYTDFINDQGGINGRRIKLLSLDDGYSPPKTLEQTRRLIEEENVAFIYQQLGTPTAMATRRYLNQKTRAATVRRLRCHTIRRSRELSVDHGLADQLPNRGAGLRTLCNERKA